MTNKHLVLAAVVAVVILGLGYFAFTALQANKPANFGAGATIGYQSSLYNQNTFNGFNSLLQDLIAVRLPLSAINQTTTAVIAWPAVSSSTPGATTTAPGLACAVGDFVMVQPVTTSSGAVVFSGACTTASTTSATFSLYATVASGSVAVTPAATNMHITVIPFATFTGAAALNTATSSSSN